MQDQILAALKKLGPSSPGQIAEHLGTEGTKLSTHFKALLDAGTIKATGVTRGRRLALPDQDLAAPAPPAARAPEAPQGEARQAAAPRQGPERAARRSSAARAPGAGRALHPDRRQGCAPHHRQRRRAAHLQRGADRGDRLAPLPALQRQRLNRMNAPTRAADLADPKLELIPLTAIAPSETHIQQLRRKRYDLETLKDLAASIGKLGVQQPGVVRKLKAMRGLASYELVAGERRWRASRLADTAHFPAIVRELTDAQVLEIQLVENIQRETLHELEEAVGYEELMKVGSLSAEQVAEKVGKSRSWVYSRLNLLRLDGAARQALEEGRLDVSRALIVARVTDPEDRAQALQLAPRNAGMARATSTRCAT
jgi:ParB/RepB/Spo0J family partition protein